MKPAPFDYRRPDSLDQALALLAEHGEAAALLAGGQSLMAMLNLRLARPEVVVDINRIAGLAGIAVEGDGVRIGALTRMAALQRSDVVAEALPLLALALPHVAHAAIRNRGSLGGSLALADPAAELPAVAVALEAEIELASATGRRRVPAEAFYRGLYETERRPDEIVVAAVFARQAAEERSLFEEESRRHGDFAIVGLAGRTRLEGGRFRDARVVYFGSESHPRPATALGQCLEGQAWDAATAALAADALAQELSPSASLEGSAAFKLHLAQSLTRRALDRLVAEAA